MNEEEENGIITRCKEQGQKEEDDNAERVI